jgi:large subunit ribosomal protein L19|uniref:Ribosomal protein L19 n=1 Tax=Thorea hispida TaxID=202687 RepID=A0A1C9CAP0_9FLOR|nr:ribosomal protein L19 [Thorea hispida]AOM65446.1 ribosomal protein L19 [Thorea hispida]UNJ79105.1 ribosomal protein L19 [Thorea hispida]
MNLMNNNYEELKKSIEDIHIKLSIPEINIGDTVRIGLLIQEGNKERVQYAEGVIIAKHKAGVNTTVTLRKIMQNIGVERIYLIHSPRIQSIIIIRKSKVRRAKLYYLRNRSGKATRLIQRIR